VYAQKVLVSRANGRFEWITLFIVRKKDGGLAIVDSNGDDYQDLDDFRANNICSARTTRSLCHGTSPPPAGRET
jgi:hypothetical protein